MARLRDVDLDGVVLDGDRLLLRPWSTDDAEPVRQVMQDRSMHEFLALPDPYTAEHAAAFVLDGARARSDGSALACAVVERASGRLVGSALLRLTDDPEIGYWIAPAARGRGYAADATRLLSAWGFQAGLHRVRLACDVANLASVRTAMAAAFRFEGVAREGIATPGDGPARRADLARFGRLASDPLAPVRPAVAPLPEGGLSDGVLRLRAMRPDDAQALYEIDDEVAVGWGFSGEPPELTECRRVAAHAGLQWLVAGTARMSMVDEHSGAVAGMITVRPAGPPQVGGIGYGVHPAFRGRGYTTRALRLLAPWAFDVADFARLELGAKLGNVASQRSAANAGFEHDGVRRARLRNPDGTFTDEVRFALVNPRYRT